MQCFVSAVTEQRVFWVGIRRRSDLPEDSLMHSRAGDRSANLPVKELHTLYIPIKLQLLKHADSLYRQVSHTSVVCFWLKRKLKYPEKKNIKAGT